jgi:FtsZ-binding cell division protein ZapB
MLNVITTNWKEFKIVFKRAWKIKATMTSVSWMENNRQKPNESIAAFVTRVQNAVATTSREALTNNANNVKEKEPKWTDHTKKYLAAQAVYDARAVETP